MPPEVTRTVFGFGVLITLASAVLVLTEPRGSPQFYLSVFSGIVGALLILAVIAVVRGSQGRGDKP